MKVNYSKEEFDRLFPDKGKGSKERIARYIANQILIRDYSLEETREIVNKNLP